MTPKTLAVLLAGLTLLLPLQAAIIGTNVPAQPLTAERIDRLSAAQQPEWRRYLEHSQKQRQADMDYIKAELVAHGLKQAVLPHAVQNAKGLSVDQPAGDYTEAECCQVADMVVSFQTPAGGWSKNTDFTRSLRTPGELFGAENGSLFLGTNDFDQTHDGSWNYVGTFDNDATTTELRFLARVISASGTNASKAWRAAFDHGLDYIFAAQYPNGGWPQVWPLQGGYHDAITINDGAMLHVVQFLSEVAGGVDDFSFVPAELRARADRSWRLGLDCLLKAQISVAGKRTVWCQQHDALTLEPVSARNFEMPAATSAESAEIVTFLMQLPEPDAREVAAVQAAAAWFTKTQITGKAFTGTGKEGKKLIDAPGHAPIWSRFYEIGTDRPIFGDRDKTIHDDVNEISKERRKGYGWYRDTPKRLLQHYRRWAAEHPPA